MQNLKLSDVHCLSMTALRNFKSSKMIPCYFKEVQIFVIPSLVLVLTTYIFFLKTSKIILECLGLNLIYRNMPHFFCTILSSIKSFANFVVNNEDRHFLRCIYKITHGEY